LFANFGAALYGRGAFGVLTFTAILASRPKDEESPFGHTSQENTIV
jgi:hypothetical protein